MSDLDDLLRRADAYAEKAVLARATVSKKLFRDARRLDQLREHPDGITLGTLKQARTRLEALERQLQSEGAPA